MRRHIKLPVIVTVIVVLLKVALSELHAEVILRQVAVTGQQAPGVEDGVVFRLLSAPLINASGQVAFESSLFGPGVNSQSNNSQGIWSERSGVLDLAVRTGHIAPDTGGGLAFSDIRDNTVRFNDSGQLAFIAQVTGPGADNSNNIGVWSGGDDSLGLVARKGEVAPGTSARFHEFDQYLFNQSGRVAFKTTLVGSGVDSTNATGIWAEDQDSLRLVVRAGGASPDILAEFIDLGAPLFNSAGQVLFQASIAGPAVDGGNDSGIWMDDGTELSTLVRSGDPAPGTSVLFTEFRDPVISSTGHIAFIANLSGTRNGTTSGVWVGAPDSLQLAVRQRDSVPGYQSEADIEGFSSFAFSETDDVIFRGLTNGLEIPTDERFGLWTGDRGELRLVARAGMSAPGTDAEFSDTGFGSDTVLATNNAGQVAFWSLLRGPGVNSTNDQGVWATDVAGNLQLILRKGDVLDTNSDPLVDNLRVIAGVGHLPGTGAEDGRAVSFNDAGQLALIVVFTDGSRGIYVATVPEPGLFLIMGNALAVLGLKRTKR